MPLDGVFISGLVSELNPLLSEARVDKIQMPEKDEVVLLVHGRGVSGRLIISANANFPRLHMGEAVKENPMSPPMFCMLLRKHLSSAKIVELSQPGLERLIKIDFLSTDEFGEPSPKSLVCELMGRYSNLILVGEDGRIIDCLKRVDISTSERRQLLPGLIYRLPPKPEKADLEDLTAGLFEDMLTKAGGEGPIERFLTGSFFGLSPLVGRELAERAAGDTGSRVGEMSEDQRQRLAREMLTLAEDIREKRLRPWSLENPETGALQDFSFMEITQYGAKYVSRQAEGFSELLAKYYTQRDLAERMSKSSADILKLISNAYERTQRKLGNQRAELLSTAERDLLRQKGDILSASVHLLERGMESVSLENFYDEMTSVEIKLDPRLSPQRNITKYYKDYNRMKSAEGHLTIQIESGEKELAYLESVLDELARARSERELEEIREELRGSGYLAKPKQDNKAKKGAKKPKKDYAPEEYRLSSGARVLVGHNNLQNDTLTLRTANRRDIWLHVKNIPGAHVVLERGAGEPSESDINEAALIAACHSKTGEGDTCQVDYCPVAHVKKPGGSRPGMVVYEGYETIMVKKDTSLIEGFKL